MRGSGDRAGGIVGRVAVLSGSVMVLLAGLVWWGPVGGGAQEGPPGLVDVEPVVVVSEDPFAGVDVVDVVGRGAEVRGLRSMFSSSFATEIPGVFRMSVSDVPVNFRGQSGVWRRIDTTLVERSDGDGFRSSANSTRVEVAGSADAAELGAVRLADGVRAGFSLEGAAEVAPVVAGAAARFEGVRPGVDVVLEATPTGLKETLVLADRSAPRSFVFPLVLDGLVAVVDEGSGAVELREAPDAPGGAPGEVRLVVPAGFVIDSAAGADGPARSDAVAYSLVEGADGSPALRVDVEDAWLDDPARVWPVSVDPSLEEASAPTADDTYVVDGESGVFHDTETSLKVGYSGTAAQRALLSFPIAPTADVAVHYAELVLTPVGACPSTVPLTLSPVLEEWDGGDIGWDAVDEDDPPFSGEPLLPDAEGVAMTSDCGDTAKVYAQVTPIVQGWVDGTLASNGVVLEAQGESDGAQLREFYSENHATSSNRPVLDITYSIEDEAGPDAPSDLTPVGELGTLNPTVVARYTHPSDTPGGLLFAMRVDASDLVLGLAYFESSPDNPVTLPSGTRGGIVVGAGLPPGMELEWRATAWAVDGAATVWSAPAAWVAIGTPDAVGCADPDDDPGEQNDTFVHATAWDGTSTVEGLVCDDPDVFVLETGGDPDLEVTLTIDDGADLDLAVYDDTGGVVDVHDSTDPTESHTFTTAGSFYVEVYGYRGASGTYTLDGDTVAP